MAVKVVNSGKVLPETLRRSQAATTAAQTPSNKARQQFGDHRRADSV